MKVMLLGVSLLAGVPLLARAGCPTYPILQEGSNHILEPLFQQRSTVGKTCSLSQTTCASDADCPAGESCTPRFGFCSQSPGVSCNYDNECPGCEQQGKCVTAEPYRLDPGVTLRTNIGVLGNGSGNCPNNNDDRCLMWPYVDVGDDGYYTPGVDVPVDISRLWARGGSTTDACDAAGSKNASCSAANHLKTGTPASCLPGHTCYTCCLDAAPGEPGLQTVAASACCTFVDNWVTGDRPNPKWIVTFTTDHGLNTPPDARCFEDWLQKGDSTVRVRALGSFRNLSWGVWKDHNPHTRLDVKAQNVLLAGFDVGQVDNVTFRSEGRYAWDRDITMTACGPSGYVIGGSYDDGANPPDSFKMNGAVAGDRTTIDAAGPDGCVSLPSPWDVYVKCGQFYASACPQSHLGVPNATFAGSCMANPVNVFTSSCNSTFTCEGWDQN